MKNLSKIYIVVGLVLVGGVGYWLGSKNSNSVLENISLKEENVTEQKAAVVSSNPTMNVFKFHNFHGQDLGSLGFEVEYPLTWQNEGQFFSPKKITHYDIYSNDAPVYYDLVSEAIIDTSDLKYQITTDKRFKPDSDVVIAGKTFKKYDLLDYQSEDKNRVIIFVGPKINIFDEGYYLVFRYEEKPLGLTLVGNSADVFEQIVKSLKFTE